ncbi:MAG: dTDP-4-dehydrorhamnose 3,5-epimerase [Rhodoferax sp.]
MEIISTSFKDCFRILPFLAKDERGTFVKTFHADRFASLGLPIEWREEYYSTSHRGVIRGMHFQTPPNDHEKLVFCTQGRALDVVLDLRKDSPTFGQHFAVELNASYGGGLFIPKGMAHGFLALTETVCMEYKVTTVYAPQSDSGIRWDSFGFDWGVTDPIVSARDSAHPAFADLESPF